MHACSAVQTEQVIFTNIHIGMESQFVKQEVTNLKKSGQGCMGAFGGWKRKGEMLQFNYNLKKVIKLFFPQFLPPWPHSHAPLSPR